MPYPKKLPHVILISLLIATAFYAFSKYDNLDEPRTGWALRFGSQATTLRGMHSNPRAKSLRSTFANSGPEPDTPPSTIQGETYTYAPPESVCAFVSDSRDFLPPSKVGLGDPSFLRNQTPRLGEGRSTAFYLNMLWSMRHKQRLTRMPAMDKEGYHGSWAKFDGLLEMADDESCKWIVYLDTDVYVRQQQYNLHDLRLRWRIHDGILLAAAKDAYDISGAYNTGFLIMNNNGNQLREVINDWATCPDRIDDCAKFKTEPLYDQAAFNDFIVPDLIEKGLFVGMPCDESNGNTYHVEHHPSLWGDNKPRLCSGSVVTHDWYNGKDHLLQEATQMLAHNLLLVLEDAMDGRWI